MLLRGPFLAVIMLAAFLTTDAQPASAAAGIGVTAGNDHTCALTSVGGIKRWGRNSEGQLGDGTTTDRATPVDVVGLIGGVAAVSAGGSRTCALTTAGGIKCWGSNNRGQLGDGTTTDRLTPVDVSGLTSGVAAISTAIVHTCAVTTAGGLKCWGLNSEGQLGDGTTTDRLTPVDVTGLTSGVTAISTGNAHTCALTTAGGIKCWGSNSEGQLGDGTTTQRLTRVDVAGLTSGVAAVSAESTHTCAVTTAGGLKCWGLNDFGQLGDGTVFRTTPVDSIGFAGLMATPIPAVSGAGLAIMAGLFAAFAWKRTRRGRQTSA